MVLFTSIKVTKTLFILKKIQVTTESYDLSGGFDPVITLKDFQPFKAQGRNSLWGTVEEH